MAAKKLRKPKKKRVFRICENNYRRCVRGTGSRDCVREYAACQKAKAHLAAKKAARTRFENRSTKPKTRSTRKGW